MFRNGDDCGIGGIGMLHEDDLDSKTLATMLSRMTPEMLSATAAAVVSGDTLHYIDKRRNFLLNHWQIEQQPSPHPPPPASESYDEALSTSSSSSNDGDIGSIKSIPISSIESPLQLSPLSPASNSANNKTTVCFDSNDLPPSIQFGMKIKIDKIRLSWHELMNNHHHHHHHHNNNNNNHTDDINDDNGDANLYQIVAFLLIDDYQPEIDDYHNEQNNPIETNINNNNNNNEVIPHHHHSKTKRPLKYRKNREKPLMIGEPIVNKRLQTVAVEMVSFTTQSLLTEIYFDNQLIEFDCQLKLETATTTSRPVFRSKVLRIELQKRSQSQSSKAYDLNTAATAAVASIDSPSTSIGFVDIDLANYAVNDGDELQLLPMILFGDYHHQLIQNCSRQTNIPGFRHCFCFDINLQVEATPRWNLTTTDNNNYNNNKTNPDPVQLKQLRRMDSFPDLSQDRELKYHDSPPFSRYDHLLNLFGVLPPGNLYRISIHFGQVEHLLLPHQINRSVSACFEVKRRGRLFLGHRHNRHHHNRHHHDRQYDQVCCRTKQLVRPGPFACDESDSGYFGQRFTFYERFYLSDPPKACLSIINNQGKQLYKFKSSLADYVHCRSVKQYFYLIGKDVENDYCLLQFSIVVKKID